jgi:hypothetical protein
VELNCRVRDTMGFVEGRVTLRTMAVAALIVTAVLGPISTLLFAVAFQFRPEWFADPALMVVAGGESAAILRWASITDLFSYYLPTGVVALALWHALRPLGVRLADAATLAALGYVLAGGAAAAALAAAGPLLLEAHSAPGADQDTVAVTFAVLIEVVRAVWQLLDAVLLGVWWLGIGSLLRTDQPRFARLTLALGGLALLGAVVTSATLEVPAVGTVRDAMLGLLFVMWTVWSVWLALLLHRRAAPFAPLASTSSNLSPAPRSARSRAGR